MTSSHRQYTTGPDPAQGVNQSAEFFLSNYRLGKTLGIGSFGKVSLTDLSVLTLTPCKNIPLPSTKVSC